MAKRAARTRKGNMQIGPNPIDFGVSPAERSADATLAIADAQSDAPLGAGIAADDCRARFRIVLLERFRWPKGHHERGEQHKQPE
jgi:hypothetical protein